MPRLTIEYVDAEVHETINSARVDKLGLPFDSDFIGSTVPIVTNIDEDETGVDDGILSYISSGHGRSFGISLSGDISEGPLLPLVVFADKFSNYYSSLNTKGNNNTRFELLRSATAPSGFLPYGIQEIDALERTITASNILRSLGVSTEWITQVSSPSKLFIAGEPVTQRQYKQRYLEQELSRRLSTTADPASQEEVKKIISALNNMSFFITTRAMDIPYRLNDFARCDVDVLLSGAIKTFNAINKSNVLDPNNSDDRFKFLVETLPTKIGRNLGKIHNAGLTHGFPHPGNISILGSIVDLDSVKGPLLGLDDEARSQNEFARDFRYLLSEEGDLYELSQSFAYLEVDEQDSCNIFKSNLLKAYFDERGYDPTTHDGAGSILKFCELIQSFGNAPFDHELVQVAINTLIGNSAGIEIDRQEMTFSLLKDDIFKNCLSPLLDAGLSEINDKPNFDNCASTSEKVQHALHFLFKYDSDFRRYIEDYAIAVILESDGGGACKIEQNTPEEMLAIKIAAIRQIRNDKKLKELIDIEKFAHGLISFLNADTEPLRSCSLIDGLLTLEEVTVFTHFVDGIRVEDFNDVPRQEFEKLLEQSDVELEYEKATMQAGTIQTTSNQPKEVVKAIITNVYHEGPSYSTATFERNIDFQLDSSTADDAYFAYIIRKQDGGLKVVVQSIE